MKRYGQRIVRERINLDQVSKAAADQIQHDAILLSDEQRSTSDACEINEDWLNNFEKEASQKSTEEMQLMFGRILAGEIQRPSSFSIKTVKLLGDLDQSAAALFRQLCSLSVSIKVNYLLLDVRVPSLDGTAASNSLARYGLSFDQLNILHEYGLIIPDYNSSSDYRVCVANEKRFVAVPMSYQNRNWALLPTAERSKDQELRLHGVALSRSGRELNKIVDIHASEEFTEALREYFEKQDLRMLQIGG